MGSTITKKGKRYWVVLYLGRDAKGKVKRKWHSSYKTKKEAKIVEANLLTEMATGRYVEPSNQSLYDYLNEWLLTYGKQNLKETTLSGYRTYLNRHIKNRIGDIFLKDLKPYQIQSFYSDLLENGRVDGKGGLSGKTVLQIHRILSKALGQAYKLQIIKNKPTDFVELPKIRKFHSDVLDEDQIKLMLNAFKDSKILIGVILGINLGLRRAEVLGLRWKDIDKDEKIVMIRNTLVSTDHGPVFTTPKSDGSYRSIKVSDSFLSLLEQEKYKQTINYEIFGDRYIEHDLICCKIDGDYFNPGRFSHIFSDTMKQHKLPSIRFHDLRHTNATLMLKHGIPAKIASSRLGHTSISITLDLYSHVDTSMQMKAVKVLDDSIFKGDG